MKRKLVCGIGINDYDGIVKIEGKMTKSYRVWYSMLNRCYSTKYHKNKPTYIKCEVCDDWKYFSRFKTWFDENYPNIDGIELQLDKDLIGGESKFYSPETCVFLPNKINSFVSNKKINNQSGYVGVSWNKQSSKWVVNITDFETAKYKRYGYFKNIEDAAKAYEEARKIEAEKVKEYMRSLGIYSEDLISKIK